MSPRLTRSDTDRVIAGVAGAIAQRFGFSSTLIRLVWVASVFFGGFGIGIYVILWIALPKSAARTSATQIAEERYARGEISPAELERIRNDLQRAMSAIFLGPMGWVGVPVVWGVMGIAFWIALIGLLVLLARGMRTTAGDSGRPAVRLLEERYARGEITREEFLERRAVLDETSPEVPSEAPR
jgi:phage shock protein PspC (stress-responsive transcriptional regulator)